METIKETKETLKPRNTRTSKKELAEPTQRPGYLDDTDSRYEFSNIELYADSKENSPAASPKAQEIQKDLRKLTSISNGSKKETFLQKNQVQKPSAFQKASKEKETNKPKSAWPDKMISPKNKRNSGNPATSSNKKPSKTNKKTGSFIKTKARDRNLSPKRQNDAVSPPSKKIPCFPL